jgi:ArsR family transcriptional regulator
VQLGLTALARYASVFLDTMRRVREPPSLLACCSPLVRPQLADEDAVELERLFRALADRHRLKVVNMLAQADGQAICVCDFQDALGLKQPTVSYHLKQLVDAGVLARERRGRFAFYSLHVGVLDRIAELVRPQAVTA